MQQPTPINKHISKLKLPYTSTIVLINGVYCPDLSDDNLFTAQTLRIQENCTDKKPIHLLFLATKDYVCTLNIIAEKNSSVKILEEFAGLEKCTYSSNVKINITAEENSLITHCKLQNENIGSNHTAQTTITQKKGSCITTNFIGKGAKLSHDTLNIFLAAENASYKARGIMSLCDAQKANYNTHIEHVAPNCASDILFKGLIDNNATGDFCALVTAHPGAYKTETHVTNKNLLLAESASMNTSPELEIYTDDVICTHGATVGQLEKDALFYLRSRGIQENIAIKMLTTAFTQEIIDEFADFCKRKISLSFSL